MIRVLQRRNKDMGFQSKNTAQFIRHDTRQSNNVSEELFKE